LLGEIDIEKGDVPAAISSLETALRYSTTIDSVDADRIREQLSGLREFTEKFARFADLEELQKGTDIVGPVLLNNAGVSYTEEARTLKIQGSVAMVLLITENGDVDSVLLYRRLGHGLDERAIEAARKLKFSPATQSGKPIRCWKRLIMGFNLR
jgi:TonB family protein